MLSSWKVAPGTMLLGCMCGVLLSSLGGKGRVFADEGMVSHQQTGFNHVDTRLAAEDAVSRLREKGVHVGVDRHGSAITVLLRLPKARGFTDDDVFLLERLPQIEVLSLENADITDNAINKLAGLNSLRWLNLGNTRVTDVGVKRVAELFPNLEQIQLPVSCTDESLKHLSRLRGLRHLHFKANNMTSNGLVHVAAFRRLEWLSIGHVGGISGIDEKGLVHLRGLSNLRHLSVPFDWTDETLPILAGFPKLETIHLRPTAPVTDGGLAAIAGMKNVQRVVLPRGITDEGLRHLGRLGSVRALDLKRTRVTAAGLKHLCGLSQLRDLHLPDSVKADGLAGLGRFPLASLGLYGKGFDDRAISQLKPLSGLAMLWLVGTSVTDDGVQQFNSDHPATQLYVRER